LTEKRLSRIEEVVSKRQKGLTVVIENVHDPHNVSAIFRTAEAVGIDRIYLIYNTNKFPKIGRISSASANKWIDRSHFNNVQDCYNELRKKEFRIYSTFMDDRESNLSLFDLDFTVNSAIVVGNEHEGLSEEASKYADCNFLIPQYGMVQSLNVSVAAAVCLYEALRQRRIAGKYSEPQYSSEELQEKIKSYLAK
jgi:tRNA (guanosine-2'-O-)-methyltransferase